MCVVRESCLQGGGARARGGDRDWGSEARCGRKSKSERAVEGGRGACGGLADPVVLFVPSGAAQCTFALVVVSRKIAHLPRGHEKRPFTFVYNVDETLVCWPVAD